MRRALTDRERKGAALLTLAAVLLALGSLLSMLVLSPLATLQTQAQALREQQRHYARVLQALPALREAAAKAPSDDAQTSRLIPGEDPNAAAADLMQLVMDRIADLTDDGQRCDIAQRTPIVAEPDSAMPYRPIKVGLTLRCATQPLARLLHALEYGQPTLFVDQLNIRPDSAAASGTGPRLLQVQLLVRGYVQPAIDAGGAP